MNEVFFIRNMTESDIPQAMQLVLEQEWNQTENDWNVFLKNPYNKCLCAIANGKLAGTGAALVFSENAAWISMLLVHPDFSGKGIGKGLLNVLLNQLTGYKSVKLDATKPGKPLYEKYGFRTDYNLTRMVCDSFKITDGLTADTRCERISQQMVKQVIKFDQHVFGVNRNTVICSLLNNYHAYCQVSDDTQKINGIVLGRQGNHFVQIGPVAAKSFEHAKLLISNMLVKLEGKPVAVDVPDDKNELVNWLLALGFEKKRTFTRMYLKHNAYRGNPQKQFLICGPEFG